MHSIPAYGNIVDKMLHVPQALENIITAAPSLDDDHVALGSGLHSIQQKNFSLKGDDRSVCKMEIM